MANVVVGVTGGIAAYKSAPLIRLFAEAGHSVQVVATQNAFRFIGKTTLEALSGKPVSVVDPDLFSDVDQVKHVAIAKSADLIVVAPATASFLAKVVAGIADDLLTTTVLAASCPVILAPAMHTEMWDNAATRSNVETLQSRGITIVWPAVGRLTGEDSGAGRLAEPKHIFQSAVASLSGILSGVRVLVTAGGTREPIDAARYVGNYSSGKQGIAFAQAAALLGAEVELIAANIDNVNLSGLKSIKVETAAELGSALNAKLGTFDVLVMAAAVADYRPTAPSLVKLKRSQIGDHLDLALVANPDLLREAVDAIREKNFKALIVGFAAETSEDLVELGRAKLALKGCDFIVANNISNGSVFGQDQTNVVLVSSDSTHIYAGTKHEVATAVLTEIASSMGES